MLILRKDSLLMANQIRDEIIRQLKNHQDLPYREFAKKLTPNTGRIIGIRIPLLRQISKEILLSDPEAFLEQTKHIYYEEDILMAMVTAGIYRTDIDQMHWIRKCTSIISNWAVCDTLASSLNHHMQNESALYQFVLACLRSSSEFEQRFGLVCLKTLFLIQHEDEIPLLLHSVHYNGYYSLMAAAWLIAEWACTNPDAAYALILDFDAYPSIQKKAIQKIQDSRRISAFQKKRFADLRTQSADTDQQS